MTAANTLLPTARALLTPAFRQGHVEVDLDQFVRLRSGGPEVRVEDLQRLLDVARERGGDELAATDRWLAPRVHALLRLTRAEAGDKGLWAWLAAVECPGYVRWRFPGKGEEEDDEQRRGTPLKRFLGQDRDNALSRLWWGAELCRDGEDYSPVERAFSMQDIPSTWLSLDAFHHPACAQAALRLLPEMQGRAVNRLATALDHVLTTIQLDVVAPAVPPDVEAVLEWRSQQVDLEELLEDSLPVGPFETRVEAAQIDVVEKLLRRVGGEMHPPLELPG